MNYIILAGCLGIGKSTLTQSMARDRGYLPFYENHEENPYLQDFYYGKLTHFFELQAHFLSLRLKQINQIKQLLQEGKKVVQDRSIYEDFHIFTRSLFLHGHLNETQWQTFSSLFEACCPLIPQADLIVYLTASTETIMGRINNRGRYYEKSIEQSYIEHIQKLYEEWIEQVDIPVLKINTDQRLPQDILREVQDFIFQPQLEKPFYRSYEIIQSSTENNLQIENSPSLS